VTRSGLEAVRRLADAPAPGRRLEGEEHQSFSVAASGLSAIAGWLSRRVQMAMVALMKHFPSVALTAVVLVLAAGCSPGPRRAA
jgi:hypothetical protein